jgi:hypothetical protein
MVIVEQSWRHVVRSRRSAGRCRISSRTSASVLSVMTSGTTSARCPPQLVALVATRRNEPDVAEHGIDPFGRESFLLELNRAGNALTPLRVRGRPAHQVRQLVGLSSRENSGDSHHCEDAARAGKARMSGLASDDFVLAERAVESRNPGQIG